MRFFTGLAVGALLLAQASTAHAQLSVNAFGGYPAGITTGSPSPYGIYSSGVVTERYGYPFTYSYRAAPVYGTSYAMPGSGTYYNSGYAGYAAPGVTSYGAASPYSSATVYPSTAYPYSNATVYPSAVYGYSTYVPTRYATSSYPAYGYRRGLFGRWRAGW